MEEFGFPPKFPEEAEEEEESTPVAKEKTDPGKPAKKVSVSDCVFSLAVVLPEIAM